MLPIDEDILQSRYGDDRLSTSWYKTWREMGLQPDEAIRATDEMRQSFNMSPPFSIPTDEQLEELRHFAEQCGEAIDALSRATDFRPPDEGKMLHFVASLRHDLATAPINPEKIAELVEDSQRISSLITDRLLHSHRSSTDTDSSNP